MTDIMARAAANCATAYREWAERTGHPTARWPDVSANDLSLAGQAPIDSASLLVPLSDEGAMHDAVDRVEQFFAARRGGPIQIWSGWPTPDLSPRGYRLRQVPGMLRQPGGEIPKPPTELTIAPVRDPADLLEVARLIDEVFHCGAPDQARLVSGALIGENCEIYLGRVADEAVATSMAFVSDGLCGIYAVATAPSARGHGYGEAVTWAATSFRADLTAALQASPMGHPVYRRMGYQQFGTFWMWQGARPEPRDAHRTKDPDAAAS